MCSVHEVVDVDGRVRRYLMSCSRLVNSLLLLLWFVQIIVRVSFGLLLWFLCHSLGVFLEIIPTFVQRASLLWALLLDLIFLFTPGVHHEIYWFVIGLVVVVYLNLLVLDSFWTEMDVFAKVLLLGIYLLRGSLLWRFSHERCLMATVTLHNLVIIQINETLLLGFVNKQVSILEIVIFYICSDIIHFPLALTFVRVFKLLLSPVDEAGRCPLRGSWLSELHLLTGVHRLHAELFIDQRQVSLRHSLVTVILTQHRVFVGIQGQAPLLVACFSSDLSPIKATIEFLELGPCLLEQARQFIAIICGFIICGNELQVLTCDLWGPHRLGLRLHDALRPLADGNWLVRLIGRTQTAVRAGLIFVCRRQGVARLLLLNVWITLVLVGRHWLIKYDLRRVGFIWRFLVDQKRRSWLLRVYHVLFVSYTSCFRVLFWNVKLLIRDQTDSLFLSLLLLRALLLDYLANVWRLYFSVSCDSFIFGLNRVRFWNHLNIHAFFRHLYHARLDFLLSWWMEQGFPTTLASWRHWFFLLLARFF